MTIHQHSLLLGWYTDSNASLTIRCLFCRTICLWPQNTPQFLISLLHWSQISFPGAFFWGLQTASSRWRPDLKSRVCKEAIQSAIPIILPSLGSTCETVHCLCQKHFFLLLWPFFGYLFLQMQQFRLFHCLKIYNCSFT